MNSSNIKVACANCSLRELCLPVGLQASELEQLSDMVKARRRLKKGEALFTNGEEFGSLFAIRLGMFKTVLNTADGRDQVTGFQMAGEILGLDGIGTDRHTCNAIALEDSEVCVIPFGDVTELSRIFPVMQLHFHKLMSREIVRDHGVMLLLGSMKAEERLAAFLLNFSQRAKARGFSSSELVLRMTREEIGSYLGLKFETVSRIFSKFHEEGTLIVQQRLVQIVNTAALQHLVNPDNC